MLKKTHALDFTLEKYWELCNSIKASGYQTVTLKEYFLKNSLPDKFVIIRHDIDRKPKNALKMAVIEQKLNIKTTYYFRAKKNVFKPDIMRLISGMGHEIGYHYETLSDAKGENNKAIELFRENLQKFRAISDIKTICMHGAPLSPYDNRDIWKYYNMNDFGLLGEAYLSVGQDLCYFSDTGRTWDMASKIRDHMPFANTIKAKTTEDLINVVESGRSDHLYILIHPERWAAGDIEWMASLATDSAVNVGKKSISVMRHQ